MVVTARRQILAGILASLIAASCQGAGTSTTSPDSTVPIAGASPASTTTDVATAGRRIPSVTWLDLTFESDEGPQHGRLVRGADRFLVLQPGAEEWDPVSEQMVDTDGDPRTLLWASHDGVEWEAHHLEQFDAMPPSLLGEGGGRVFVADGAFLDPFTSTDLTTWEPFEAPLKADGTRTYLAALAGVDAAVVVRSVGGPDLVRVGPSLEDAVVVEGVFGALDPFVERITATQDRFYALVYNNENGNSAVWSSPDGLAWQQEAIAGGVDGIGAIAANDTHVLLSTGQEWWVAESGGPFVPVDGPRDQGEVFIAATDVGFVVGYTAGFGDAALRSSGPYITADGHTWGALEPIGVPLVSMAGVGDRLLVATGDWVVRRNAQGDVASEEWVHDGSWIVGVLTP